MDYLNARNHYVSCKYPYQHVSVPIAANCDVTPLTIDQASSSPSLPSLSYLRLLPPQDLTRSLLPQVPPSLPSPLRVPLQAPLQPMLRRQAISSLKVLLTRSLRSSPASWHLFWSFSLVRRHGTYFSEDGEDPRSREEESRTSSG